MENNTFNTDLTILQKIGLFALLSLILGLYQFIMKLLVINIGISELAYPRLYLQILPGLYIFFKKYINRSFRLPHLFSIMLLLILYILFEEYFALFRSNDPHLYHFFWNLLNMYIFEVFIKMLISGIR